MSGSMSTFTSSRSILDLNFFQKTAVASGHFVNDVTASIWFSYYLLYIQEVAGLSPYLGAGLMLLGETVDAVSTPVIGYLADRGWGSRGCGFGRLKSWHLFGVGLATFTFPLIFSPPIGLSDASEWAKVAYYTPFIIIYEISWAAVQISHLAIIPKMSPDMFIRTEILSIRYIQMVIANVIVFLVMWYSVGVAKHCHISREDAPVFQHLAMISMAIGLVTALFFYATTKEHGDQEVKEAVIAWEKKAELEENSRNGIRNNLHSLREEVNHSTPSETTALLRSPPESRQTPGPRRRKISLSTKHLNPGRSKMTVWQWFKTPQFYMVAAIYIPGRLIINVPQAFLPLYLQKTLNLPCSMVAVLPLTYFLSGFVVATTMKKLAKWVGKQMSFLFGIILNLLGASFILWGDWSTGSFLREVGVYGVFALLGGGACSGMVTGLSITADLIGNNVESSAFVYSFMSFWDKMCCGIAIMSISIFTPTSAEDASIFFRDVVAFSCVGCSLMAIIGLITITVLIFIKTSRAKATNTNHASPG